MPNTMIRSFSPMTYLELGIFQLLPKTFELISPVNLSFALRLPDRPS